MRVTPRNTVTIAPDALINSAGNVNLLAGRSVEENPITAADKWIVKSNWDGFAGSLIPISSIDAVTRLEIINNIDVGANSQIFSDRRVNLFAQDITMARVEGQAKQTSWVSAVQDAFNALLGGDGTANYIGTTIAQAKATVLVNGSITTGLKRNKTIVIDYLNGNPALGVIAVTVTSGGVTFEDVPLPEEGTIEVNGILFTTGLKVRLNDAQAELQSAIKQLELYGATNTLLRDFYLDRIATLSAQLQAQGLAECTNGPSGPSCVFDGGEVFTIDIGEISAQPGIIDVRTTVFQGGGPTAILTAPRDVAVSITNATIAFLAIDGIHIPAVEGGVYLNGNRVTEFEDANEAVRLSNVAETSLVNAQDPLGEIENIQPGPKPTFTFSTTARVDPSIVIMNTGGIPSGIQAPYPDITVTAEGTGITNNNGSVTLQTLPSGTGSVIINNRLEAKTLSIVAGGDVYINTSKTHNIRGNGDGQIGNATHGTYGNTDGSQAAGVAPGCLNRGAASPIGEYTCTVTTPATCTTSGGVGFRIYTCTFPQHTVSNNVNAQLHAALVAANQANGTGAPYTVAGGRIYISAPIINLNGVIQSGRDQFTLNIGGPTAAGTALLNEALGFTADTGTKELTQANLANPAFRVQYDTDNERFLVDPIATRGGYVELHGTVLSTGNGSIRVLGGYPTVTVDNQSGKEVVIGGIDLTRQGAGTLIIADGGRGNPNLANQAAAGTSTTTPTNPYATIYQWTPNGVLVQTNNGPSGTIVNPAITATTPRLVNGQTVNVFAVPDYSPDARYRYGWQTNTGIGVTKVWVFKSRSLFGFIPIGSETERQPDSIKVSSQPTIPEPSGRYFFVSSTPNDEYTYRQQTIQTGSDRTEASSSRCIFRVFGACVAREYTKVVTRVETYTITNQHSINAHRPISITFLGQSGGDINITSNANIKVTGAIENPTGTTRIHAPNHAIQVLGGRISGRVIDLLARESIGSEVAPVPTRISSFDVAGSSASSTPVRLNTPLFKYDSGSGSKTVLTNQTVFVSENYNTGLGTPGQAYKRIGGNATLNLGTVDFTDTAQWEAISLLEHQATYISGAGAINLVWGDTVRLTDNVSSTLGDPGTVYQYVGPATTSPVNLGTNNYKNTALWSQRTVSTNDVVKDGTDYYSYIGKAAALNLQAQNFGDRTKWIPITQRPGLTVVSTHGGVFINDASRETPIRNVQAGNGDVLLTSEGSMPVAEGSSAYGTVSGNKLTLIAGGKTATATGASPNAGSIGALDLPLRINTGSTSQFDLDVRARGDVALTETTGNLFLNMLQAGGGDVRLEVANGSLFNNNINVQTDPRTYAELSQSVYRSLGLLNEHAVEDQWDEFTDNKAAEWEGFWKLAAQYNGSLVKLTQTERDHFIRLYAAEGKDQMEIEASIFTLEASRTDQYLTLKAQFEAYFNRTGPDDPGVMPTSFTRMTQFTDGNVTTAQTILASSLATFLPTDVGKTIVVDGQTNTIAAFIDSHHVRLTTAYPGDRTVSDATVSTTLTRLQSDSAPFVLADVGRPIEVNGEANTIAGFIDAETVRLSIAARNAAGVEFKFLDVPTPAEYTDGALIEGVTILNSPSTTFTADDIGKTIIVGTVNNKIVAITTPTTVRLESFATPGTGVQVTYRPEENEARPFVYSVGGADAIVTSTSTLKTFAIDFSGADAGESITVGGQPNTILSVVGPHEVRLAGAATAGSGITFSYTPTYEDADVIGDGTHLISGQANFSILDVGKTITVEGVSNTIATVVDGHHITLGTAATLGNDLDLSYTISSTLGIVSGVTTLVANSAGFSPGDVGKAIVVDGVNNVIASVIDSRRVTLQTAQTSAASHADGVITGGTNPNLQSSAATFSPLDVGKAITIGEVTRTIKAFVDAHNVTIEGTVANDTGLTFSYLRSVNYGSDRTFADGMLTTGASSVTSATAVFASTDVGKTIKVGNLVTTITAVTSATTAQLAINAPTASGVTFAYNPSQTDGAITQTSNFETDFSVFDRDDVGESITIGGTSYTIGGIVDDHTIWVAAVIAPATGVSYSYDSITQTGTVTAGRARLTSAQATFVREDKGNPILVGSTSTFIDEVAADGSILLRDPVANATGLAFSYEPEFHYLLSQAEKNAIASGVKVWTEDQLQNLLGAGLLKPVSSTLAVIGDAIINANDVTIIANGLAPSGAVGRNDGEAIIHLDGHHFTPDENVLLTTAERTDIQFLGGSRYTITATYASSDNSITLASGSWAAMGVTTGVVIRVIGNTLTRFDGYANYLVTGTSGANKVFIDAATPLENETVTVQVIPILDPTITTTLTFTAGDGITGATITRNAGSGWGSIVAGSTITITGNTPNATGAGSSTGVSYYTVETVVDGTTLRLVPADVIQTTGPTTNLKIRPLVLDPTFEAIDAPFSATVNFVNRGFGTGGRVGDVIEWIGGNFTGLVAAGDVIQVGGSESNDTANFVPFHVVELLDGGTKLRLATNDILFDENNVTVAITRGQQPVVTQIVIAKVKPVFLTATGVLNVEADGNVLIGSAFDLNLGLVETPGEVRLKTLGSITNAGLASDEGSPCDEAGPNVNLCTGNAILEAGSGHIGTATAPIYSDFFDAPVYGTLTARARHDIWILNRNNDGDAGDLRIESVYSEQGKVRLEADGSILDALATPFTKIFAPSIELHASGGTIGADGNALEVLSGPVTAHASESIWIDEVNLGGNPTR